jgi:hypothetical protein
MTGTARGFRIRSVKPASRANSDRETTIQDIRTGNYINNIDRIVITLEDDMVQAEITLTDGEVINAAISDIVAYEG